MARRTEEAEGLKSDTVSTNNSHVDNLYGQVCQPIRVCHTGCCLFATPQHGPGFFLFDQMKHWHFWAVKRHRAVNPNPCFKMSQKTISNVKEPTCLLPYSVFLYRSWIGMEFVHPAHAELRISGLTCLQLSIRPKTAGRCLMDCGKWHLKGTLWYFYYK